MLAPDQLKARMITKTAMVLRCELERTLRVRTAREVLPLRRTDERRIQRVPGTGWASIFLFATLDGTISGWAPQSDRNNAIIAVDNSKSGAVYTGLAITNKANFLFAADQANNKVDIYNDNFKLVKSFTDTTVPAGFAPFGIQDINGLDYVAFASASGIAGGVVDVFDEDGTRLRRLAQGGPLN